MGDRESAGRRLPCATGSSSLVARARLGRAHFEKLSSSCQQKHHAVDCPSGSDSRSLTARFRTRSATRACRRTHRNDCARRSSAASSSGRWKTYHLRIKKVIGLPCSRWDPGKRRPLCACAIGVPARKAAICLPSGGCAKHSKGRSGVSWDMVHHQSILPAKASPFKDAKWHSGGTGTG